MMKFPLHTTNGLLPIPTSRTRLLLNGVKYLVYVILSFCGQTFGIKKLTTWPEPPLVTKDIPKE